MVINSFIEQCIVVLHRRMTGWNIVILATIAVVFIIPSCRAEKEFYIFTVGNKGNAVTQVQHDNPKQFFRSFDNSNELAKAAFNPTYNETGWDVIEIKTNEAFPDEQQAYAAGYIEGKLTHDAIYNHWYNSLEDFCKTQGKEICSAVDDFVRTNMRWVKSNTEQYGDKSDYWHQIKLYYKQLEGIADGYSSVNTNHSTVLRLEDILLLNNADLWDIVEVIKARKSDFKKMDIDNDPRILGLLRCSALVKILPDGRELYTAQDTWSEYGSMLRTLKKYNFGYHNVTHPEQIISGRTMTFSSYPGVITSGDDFYVISSGLVTMETTIGNSNVSLWRYVQPENQVSEAARSMVANRLAKNGRTWSKIFSQFNSGTYNNQWMIVDYNKFKKWTKPKDLPDEILWIVEQIPGYIHSEDMTSILRNQGYWPSYNVAYFEDIYNKSGNLPMVEKFGDWFTYDKTPRALIFKRDHDKVSNLKSMLNLMRYIDFKHDPLSACNCTPPYSGENAIAARCDLNPKNGTYPFPALGHRSHGATDAKITSQTLILNGLQFIAVSGPPHNISRGIPPFQWSTAEFGNTTRHVGHPDVWKFKPIIYNWS